MYKVAPFCQHSFWHHSQNSFQASLWSIVFLWDHFTTQMSKDIDPQDLCLPMYLRHAVIPPTLDAPCRVSHCARNAVLLSDGSLKSNWFPNYALLTWMKRHSIYPPAAEQKKKKESDRTKQQQQSRAKGTGRTGSLCWKWAEIPREWNDPG